MRTLIQRIYSRIKGLFIRLKQFLKRIAEPLERIKAVFCGFMNGFFGGGAGLIIIPFIKARSGDIHKAHGTAPAITFMLSLMSAALYIVDGNTDWGLTLKTVIGIVPGAVLGAFVLPKVPANILERFFAIIMIVSALRMMA